MAAGAFASGRDELIEAVRLEPKLTNGWISLGVARYRLGDVWGATVAMSRALAIAPTNNIAEANFAVFLALRGEQEEAIKRLRTVLVREPACAQARIALGSLLIIDSEPAEALEALTGTPPEGSLGVHWRAQRVSALFNLGRRAEARAELDAITGPLGEAEILIAGRQLLFALCGTQSRPSRRACRARRDARRRRDGSSDRASNYRPFRPRPLPQFAPRAGARRRTFAARACAHRSQPAIFAGTIRGFLRGQRGGLQQRASAQRAPRQQS